MKKYNLEKTIVNYRHKRLLHLISNSCSIINLIVFAILLPDIRVWTLGVAALFVAYTVVFLFDKRKHEWDWWCIFFEITIGISISVCYILLFDLYFYFAVVVAQVIISSVIFCIFKKMICHQKGHLRVSFLCWSTNALKRVGFKFTIM